MSANSSWTIDPATRDYVLDSQGAPLVDNGLRMPIYIRLRTHRGQWLYAPDAQYGSNFFQIKRNITTGSQSNVINTGVDALQPLINDGRAGDIDVSLGDVSRNGVELNIIASDARGEPENLTFVQIEV